MKAFPTLKCEHEEDRENSLERWSPEFAYATLVPTVCANHIAYLDLLG